MMSLKNLIMSRLLRKNIRAFLCATYVFFCLNLFTFAHSGHKHVEKLRISLPNVVAKINGEDILSESIAQQLKKTLTNYKDKGIPLSVEQEKIATKKLIDNEISRVLILQKGREIGIQVNKEMVDKKMKQIKTSFKSDAVFEHELKDRKMTIEEYREELKVDLLMQQVINQEIEPNVKVDKNDIATFYEKNKNRFAKERKVRASVILIKAKPGDKKSEKLARKKIGRILQQIKIGSSFSEMAIKYSQDSLASKGGDLGYFSKHQMFGAFSSRAFDMKVGEVSEIFKTAHGFHILKLNDINKGNTIPLDRVRKKIEKELKESKMGSATRNYIKTLRENSKIKIYF